MARMKHPILHRLLLLAVLAALLALIPGAVAAQTGPTVTDQAAGNNFPEGLNFTVSAQSDADIEDIRLRYRILPDGTAAIGNTEFDPAPSVTTEFELEGNNPPRIYLAPGTVIEYRWEVTDATGETAVTDTATIVYEDIRFDWSLLDDQGVRLYYYSGSESDARAMLDVAVEALEDVSALLQAEVEFPVNVWIYESPDDMRPALARRSETYEQHVTTAGVRVSSDTVLVLGNAAFDVLRHELAHVVTKIAGEGPFGRLPAWLDEGTAVYAQESPGGFRTAIERAISRGEVLSVRSITSYPGDPGTVNVFYGQSWSLVKYLVEEHGPGQFAQLFAEIKSGKRIDAALEAVYGFDQDGLENEWRAHHGLPPRPAADPDDPPAPANGEPPPNDRPAADDTTGLSAGTIAGLAAAIFVLVLMLVLLTLTVYHRLR
jgi:hypothetical protein